MLPIRKPSIIQRALTIFGDIFQLTVISSGGLAFRPVRWTQKFEKVHPYEPNQGEYLDGLVVRPKLAGEVVDRLCTHGWAVVLGRGASGKSVLGNLLTLDRQLRPDQSFRLDLALYSDSALLNPITPEIFAQTKSRTLFIVDNVHLNEDLTNDIWEVWSSLSIRPFLLLLGRELQRRRGTRFSNQAAQPIILRALDVEVRGVFNRLATRWLQENGRTDSPPAIPSTFVEQWISTFGGPSLNPHTTVDLMALSAAIRRKIDSLLKGDWPLTPADARIEVREKYLAVEENERRNLIRLSALPDDFCLPSDDLFDPFIGFKQSLNQGVVFEIEYGRERRVSYRFAHSALGHLILDAGADIGAVGRERRAIVTSDPYSSVAMAQQFLKGGDRSAAVQVLQMLVSSPDWLSRYSGHSGNLKTALNLIVDMGVLSLPEACKMLTVQLGQLKRLIMATPLSALVGFLMYTDCEDFRPLNKIVTEELVARATEVAEKASTTTLDILSRVLNYSEKSELQPLRQAIIRFLDDHTSDLIKITLRSDLSEASYFLTATKSDDLSDLRDAVIAILNRNAHELLATSLDASFWKVVNFLAVAQAERVEELHNKFLTILQSPKSLSAMATRVCREGANGLASLSEFPALGREVCAIIDRSAWDEARTEEQPMQGEQFGSLVRNCAAMECADLTRSIATNIVRRVALEQWAYEQVRIDHLSHIIRLTAASQNEVRSFLVKVTTPSWLDRQYSNARTGTLAGALLALSYNLDGELKTIFVAPSLRKRIDKVLAFRSADDVVGWAEAISLIGSFARIGGDTSAISVPNWMDNECLQLVVAAREVKEGQVEIDYLQAQLWIGLREMARLRPEVIMVERDFADRILRVWREAKSENPRIIALNEEMIAWLENCARSGWTLVR